MLVVCVRLVLYVKQKNFVEQIVSEMKELLLSFLFALIVGSAINGLYQSEMPSLDSSSQDETSTQKASHSLTETSDASFQKDVLQSEMPVFVDFRAEWCGPCKKMLPIVGALAAEFDGRIKVYSLDIDANPQTAAQYNIKEIPTFILFKNGSKLETITGATNKEHLVGVIEQSLN